AKKFDITSEDIQKGKWGKKSVDGDFRLTATVSIGKSKGFYDVVIWVELLDGAAIFHPVAYFVHDSFGFQNNVIVSVPNDEGVPKVKLSAIEAFCLGALLPDGTELELDLNEVPGYPPSFYWEANEQNKLFVNGLI
ncbi:MAG: hypothetical protein WAR77_03880, partial [Saprospiraceae bacterium]